MMTPFGEAMRALRGQKGVSARKRWPLQSASRLPISPRSNTAKRGAPSFDFLQRVAGYFNVIWDEADELFRRGLPVRPPRGGRYGRSFRRPIPHLPTVWRSRFALFRPNAITDHPFLENASEKARADNELPMIPCFLPLQAVPDLEPWAKSL